MDNKKKKTKSDIEWEKRKLCRDPACIGVIGADGRCKECGKSYEGEAFEDSAFVESESEFDSEFESDSESATDEIVEEQVEDYEETETDDEGESTTDEEWANRKLCSDPACIGVIGPNGRCKECGKAYKGK